MKIFEYSYFYELEGSFNLRSDSVKRNEGTSMLFLFLFSHIFPKN